MVAFVFNPSTWMLAGLVLAIGLLLFRVQRQLGLRRRADAGHLAAARVEGRGRIAMPAPDDVVAWQVEMQELARELAAQLDSKMVALQQLIRDADRASARLEAALAAEGDGCGEGLAEEQCRPQAAAHDAGPPPASTPRDPAERDRYEEIYTLCDYGFSPQEIAGRVGNTAGEVELILALRKRR